MPELTPAELAAENERLKLACQSYRKFIQAEMHFEGYRGVRINIWIDDDPETLVRGH